MTNDWFRDSYPDLLEGRDVPDGVGRAVAALMAGDFADWQAAAWLTALKMKGESSAEIAAAARVMRDHMVTLDAGGRAVLDTCGTGGDGGGTFNISTAVALVVAGCGVPVVKHGNRAVSGKTGSADALAALGVPIDLDPASAAACLARADFAFCFAPEFHPAMANVGPLRKKLGVRTVFNLLGPLANPAAAQFQLLGVGKPELIDPLAGAAAALGTTQTILVHAEDGLDEVSLAAPTRAVRVRGDEIREERWTPADFGLPAPPPGSLAADGPERSAAIIRGVLADEPTPARDVVLANAAAALLAAGRCETLCDGVGVAAAALRSGAALRVLERLSDGSAGGEETQ